MLPHYYGPTEDRPLPSEEVDASRLIMSVLAILLVITLLTAWFTGGTEKSYGIAIWISFMAWIPTTLVVGPIAEQYGWVKIS